MTLQKIREIGSELRTFNDHWKTLKFLVALNLLIGNNSWTSLARCCGLLSLGAESASLALSDRATGTEVHSRAAPIVFLCLESATQRGHTNLQTRYFLNRELVAATMAERVSV